MPHQSVKGRGVDCKGFLLGVTRDLGFPEAASVYALDLDYNLGKRGGIPSARLKEGFAALFDPGDIANLKPGNILLCKVGGNAGHIAIWDGARAWNALADSGVRPRTLRALFHRFPLDSVWSWRDG